MPRVQKSAYARDQEPWQNRMGHATDLRHVDLMNCLVKYFKLRVPDEPVPDIKQIAKNANEVEVLSFLEMSLQNHEKTIWMLEDS